MLYGVICVCIDLCTLCKNNKKRNDKKTKKKSIIHVRMGYKNPSLTSPFVITWQASEWQTAILGMDIFYPTLTLMIES